MIWFDKILMMKNNFQQILKQYRVQAFWDTPNESIDCVKHRDFIIERLLQCGGLNGIQWIFENYGVEAIKQVVMKSRFLSKRTVCFWAVYFAISPDNIICLSKPTLFPMR